MATGKISVVRRLDASNVSRKVSGHCYGESDFRVKIRSNSGSDLDYEVKRRGVFVKEHDEGIVVSPPHKKRKFSPVLWGEEDAIRYLASREVDVESEQEPGELVEEDFSCVPNIMKSRWASDDDVEECCGGEKGGLGSKGRRSSPESGVTQKDSSDAGSDGGFVARVYSEGECSDSDMDDGCDRMELDMSDDDNLACDDSNKAEVSGQVRRNMRQCSRSVFDYEKLGKISEGSYGIVYKARDKVTGDFVALKKMKLGNQSEGFPVYYLREINMLMSLNHPSIVNVREVVVDDSADGFDSIYMVMDYVEHDLKLLMQARKQPFRQSEVKCLMLQLLEGVKYLHDNWVLHRDLKTSNLLLNNSGELKICDFGMSRQYGSPLKQYTSLVVTLWYRAPELLLGAKEYSTAVDMWSVGCIMAELLTNKPLFDGKTEIEQLDKIYRTLGTPNDKIWPGYSQLPGIRANFAHQPYNQLHKKFPRASFTDSPVLSDSGLDLLSRLLTYDTEKRITAEVALNHPWFQDVPLPNSQEFMPTFPAHK